MNTYAHLQKKRVQKLVINLKPRQKYSPKIEVYKEDPLSVDVILGAHKHQGNKKIYLKSQEEWFENEKLIRFYHKYG
jgi:hypothetical protein